MYNIALICDDAYVLPTKVTIQSILNCYSSDVGMVNIHVCSPSLLDSNIKCFEKMSTSQVHVHVHVIKLDALKINSVVSKTHVTNAALIKFELPNIFPTIGCMLYLDSDIVVKKDFFQIFNTNVENVYLAAVYEFWKYLEKLRFCPADLNKNTFYFNSGVMLFNLERMRADNIAEKLWDYKLNNSKSRLMDQESFNAVCGARVRPLALKWNLNPVFCSDEYLPIINKVFSENYVEVKSLVDDANVIHYVGKADKPWMFKFAKMREFWDANYIGDKLHLIDYKPAQKSKIRRVFEIVSDYGFYGLFSFVKFRLKERFK